MAHGKNTLACAPDPNGFYPLAGFDPGWLLDLYAFTLAPLSAPKL